MNRSSFLGKIVVLAFAALILPFSAIAQPALRTAMDYDNDDKADFAVFRPEDANWWQLLSNGGVAVQSWGIPDDDYLTPGDYDGDGKGDIAVWRDSNGFWFIINSATSTVSIYSWGNAGDEPVARDYNNDDKTDIAVVRKTGGFLIWWVLVITPGGHEVINRSWGIDTDFVAPGDYDGDGSWDFAVQRADANGSVFWIQNAAGISSIPFGATGDLCVPGDYDGDEKTDIAVIREGSTFNSPITWLVRRSIDGQQVNFSWGITGSDLSAQNDYDGDGWTEIAIWRNTDGNFWTLSPRTGEVRTVSWGNPNDRPIANYDTH